MFNSLCAVFIKFSSHAWILNLFSYCRGSPHIFSIKMNIIVGITNASGSDGWWMKYLLNLMIYFYMRISSPFMAYFFLGWFTFMLEKESSFIYILEGCKPNSRLLLQWIWINAKSGCRLVKNIRLPFILIYYPSDNEWPNFM